MFWYCIPQYLYLSTSRYVNYSVTRYNIMQCILVLCCSTGSSDYPPLSPSYFIPHSFFFFTIGDAAGVLQEFKGWFEDNSVRKVWHNYGFDRHVMNNEGAIVLLNSINIYFKLRYFVVKILFLKEQL